MTDEKPDYDVGYGRPPKHRRFAPGQSGNPKGRKKGSKNLATDLAEELAETIRVREGARERSVSKQRAMLKALVAKALKGDTRAAHLLIGLVAAQVVSAPAAQDEAPLSESDQQILEDFLRRNAPAAPAPGGSNEDQTNEPEARDD